MQLTIDSNCSFLNGLPKQSISPPPNSLTLLRSNSQKAAAWKNYPLKPESSVFIQTAKYRYSPLRHADADWLWRHRVSVEEVDLRGEHCQPFFPYYLTKSGGTRALPQHLSVWWCTIHAECELMTPTCTSSNQKQNPPFWASSMTHQSQSLIYLGAVLDNTGILKSSVARHPPPPNAISLTIFKIDSFKVPT